VITVGRRLTLKLLQRQVAPQLGVNRATITNWERNGAQPTLKYMASAPAASFGWAKAGACKEGHFSPPRAIT